MGYIYNEIKIGGIYKNKLGLEFKILEENFSLNRKAFLIEFLNTKTKKVYSESVIKLGQIVDFNSPTVNNIGIIGEEFDLNNPNYSTSRIYKTWMKILTRCCDSTNYDYKYYGEKGIKICEEWKYFPNFYNWFNNQKYKEGELDKDIIALAYKMNFKIYSPETCLLIPARLNQFFITYNNEGSNIRKTSCGYQASIHFGDKMIRSKYNLSYEEALSEKKRIKKECFLKLSKELNLDIKLHNLCLKIFE